MKDPQTEQLVRQAKNGDKSAYDGLYSIYSKPLQRYLMGKMSRSEQDAQDIVSETFFVIMTHIDRLQDDAKFESWAYTIAKRIALHQIKKDAKHRRVTFTANEDGEDGDIEEAALEQAYQKAHGDTILLPDDYAENEDVKRIIAEQIETLSPAQKEVLFLSFYQNLSVTEIAELTHKTPNNVSVQLNKAKSTLKKKLETLQKKGVTLCAVPLFLLIPRFGKLFSPAIGTGAAAEEAVNALRTKANAPASAGRAAGSRAKAGFSGAKIAIISTAAIVTIGVGSAVVSTAQQHQKQPEESKPVVSTSDVILQETPRETEPPATEPEQPTEPQEDDAMKPAIPPHPYSGVYIVNENGDLYNSYQNNPCVLQDVAAVYSDKQSCAIKKNGDLYVWDTYYLGDGTERLTSKQSTPYRCTGNVVKALPISPEGYVILKKDGSVYSWGCTYDDETAFDSQPKGTLGLGTYQEQHGDWISEHVVGAKPVLTMQLVMEDVVDIATDGTTCAAIDNNGDLYMWGTNDWGKLTEAIKDTYSAYPTKVMSDVTSVTLGAETVAAITSDGSLYTWGSNQDGQLGNGESYISMQYRATPGKIMDHVRSVTLSYDNCFAVTADDHVYVWADTFYYQGQYINEEEAYTPHLFNGLDAHTGFEIAEIYYGDVVLTPKGALRFKLEDAWCDVQAYIAYLQAKKANTGG